MNRELKHLIFTAIFQDFALRNKDVIPIIDKKKEIVSMYLNDKISIPEYIVQKLADHFKVDINLYKQKMINDKKDARFANQK